MLNESSVLALRLEGPLQSWGCDSQFNRRNTGLLPTKSGIAGMCCAAMGFSRASEKEQMFLKDFLKVNMLAIAIPRHTNQKKELLVRRMQDYHTIHGTAIAKRKKSGALDFKETHITYRHYLLDAYFLVLLSGNIEILEACAVKLQNPDWGLWLGRKACVPSAPIFAGLYPTEDDALCELLNGRKLEEFTHQRDATKFAEGKDSFMDQALCFGAPGKPRKYAPRRIIRHEAVLK